MARSIVPDAGEPQEHTPKLTRMSPPQLRRRWVRRLTIPFALGLALTFVPLPQMSFVSASVVDRLPLPVLSEAGASELSDIQAVLDAAPADHGDHPDEVDAAASATTSVPQTSSSVPEPTSTAPATSTTSTVPDVADEHTSEQLSADRVAGVEADVPTFTAIGVLLDEQPSEPVMVRVRDADGSWGDWRELAVETAEGPDIVPGSGPVEGSGYGTEPIWVDHAMGYELNLGAADAETAQVALVRDQLHRSVADATPMAGAAVAPPFGIHLRAEWGARASDTSVGSTVKLAIVHHSDSSNDYSPSDVPAVLRSIQAYHMDGRGWSDIAYNFVVDKYGGIWEGRGGGIDRPVIGAHSQGFNTNTVGVMVIGDFTQATPGAATLESVSRVIGWKLALHNVDPAGSVAFTSGGSPKYDAGVVVNLPRVVGHQDVGLTSCPGSIEGYLGQIRSRAQEWTTWVRATMAPQGAYDTLVPGVGGTLTATGWVVDLDVTGPSQIVLSSEGRTLTATADQSRPDVGAIYPDQGDNHGFWVQWGGFSPGWHEVCVAAVNRGNGENAWLGCRGATVPEASGRSPVADIAASSAGPGSIDVAGWASDPDGGPVPVALTVDGEWRRDVTGSTLSARLLGIPVGGHLVCAEVVNYGPGMNMRADCERVYVAGSSPIGRLESLGAGPNSISATGWAFDPETLDPIVVAMIIDGQWHTTWASRPRSDWMNLYPGWGNSHGMAIGVNVTKGTHWTCVAAMNVAGGGDTMLGCQNVVVK